LDGREIQHNKELHNFYSSPNIIIRSKLKMTRLAGTMACMGKSGLHEGFWRENQKKIVLVVNGRIILKRILEK
jgi:hypothetical protein